jgi:hypothetical protein
MIAVPKSWNRVKFDLVAAGMSTVGPHAAVGMLPYGRHLRPTALLARNCTVNSNAIQVAIGVQLCIFIHHLQQQCDLGAGCCC